MVPDAVADLHGVIEDSLGGGFVGVFSATDWNFEKAGLRRLGPPPGEGRLCGETFTPPGAVASVSTTKHDDYGKAADCASSAAAGVSGDGVTAVDGRCGMPSGQ